MLIIIVPTAIIIMLFVIAYLVRNDFDCDVSFMLRCVAVVLLILVIGATVLAFFVHQCADSSTASYRVQYETLVYQLENGAYENVVEYNRKDLMNDICDYNSHIESGRILSKNPWIGVYYPEDWDNLPLIQLGDYK